ncbi:MlaD family protein [Thermoflexibacter ruber]|uniref:Phospholipid/cholesterol/gamma-HCH transport system substrate-binding protein n=1 Tax=Thermoflexibacter ruber TaxID=1003 RepID=A0A1I2GP05_9BACT|nr:MlaD family protein [Thermoflexibacter ruber]SFF19305.1 phospholipid/cholesterol/gamma-HCH transport system substrate-binding protein [Thermoflexibacter ruber]
MSKELKVGLLTVIGGVILYFGVNFLKGYDFLSSTATYFVVYDKIDGLVPSNPVQINGMSVGKVIATEILQNQSSKILVEFDLDKKIKLNTNSVAILKDNGLLGGKMIEIVVNQGQAIKQDDTLKANIDQGLMGMVASKANPLMSSLDTTITSVNQLLTEYKGLSSNIKNILNNLESTTGNVNRIMIDNRQRISNITSNLDKLSTSLVETEKSIKPLMSKMNTIADSVNAMKLASTMQEARKSVENLNEMLNSMKQGETLTKLMGNDSVYVNLNKTIADLDKLLVDFREHPKRYVHFSVFGRKDKSEPKK